MTDNSMLLIVPGNRIVNNFTENDHSSISFTKEQAEQLKLQVESYLNFECQEND